jgi:hypothetical protein
MFDVKIENEIRDLNNHTETSNRTMIKTKFMPQFGLINALNYGRVKLDFSCVILLEEFHKSRYLSMFWFMYELISVRKVCGQNLINTTCSLFNLAFGARIL